MWLKSYFETEMKSWLEKIANVILDKEDIRVEFDEQVRRQELAYASLARLITDNAAILLEASTWSADDLDRLPPHLDAALAELRVSPDLLTATRLTIRANFANRIWHEGTLERARDVLAALPDDGAGTTP